MSKEKHTPDEWSYHPTVSGLMNVLRNGQAMFQTASLDLAENIVKSMNNHDRLVEALEKLQHAVIEYPFADNRTLKACIESKKLLTELKQQ